MDKLNNYEKYIKESMDSWHCPGVGIAVIKGDAEIFKKTFGWRDVEEKLPVTEDTRFAMASVTKSFTAMCIALLADEGKIDWDKPVREYMPEFILAEPYVTQNITVRDMLSHRTGLPRHDFSAWRLDISRAEFIKRMKHFKFSATFREKFQYNNLMYYAAAYLVEKVSGQKWEDFVTERIFIPLGMKSSSLCPETPGKEQVNAKGYRVERADDGSFKHLVNMPLGKHTELSPGAAGALFSTLADLTRWLKVHINDGCLGDRQFISGNNLKQMHIPHMVIPGGGFSEKLTGNTIFTYGMGWFIEPYRGYTVIQHGGNVEGHSLVIGFIPQERLGIIALTNIAMLPLRDVLLYESIDRVLGLKGRDWNRKYHEMFDPIIRAESKSRETSADEKIKKAPMTHSLDSYTGAYSAEGYPDFAVREENGKLLACSVGSTEWSDLCHYHYNVFEWYIADFDFWAKIRFLINDNGEVDSVSMPLEPSVDNIIYKRKPPEMLEDIVNAVTGDYDSPIKGIIYSIKKREGKLYFSETGLSPREIKPYKISRNTAVFRKGRDRLEFLIKGKMAVSLIIKGPFMTMEAPRKS